MRIAKYLFTICLMTAVAAVYGQLGMTPQINREPGRMATIPYATDQKALAASREASEYMQPLGGEWRGKKLSSKAEIKDAVATASGWDKVLVPEKGVSRGKLVVYQRDFKYPFNWVGRQMFLYIGGASSPYEIYINGKFAGMNQNPRVPAEFDVTNFSEEGRNTVSLVLYAETEAGVLSGAVKGEAALTGEIYMIAQPKIRIRNITYTSTVSGNQATINLGVILKSHYLNTKEVYVNYKLFDPEGNMVLNDTREAEFRLRAEDTVRFAAVVKNPAFWSYETPQLYTLQVREQYEGRWLEYLCYRVGINDMQYRDGALRQGGVKIPMMVTVWEPSGDLITDVEAVRGMKSRGVNTIKLKNYPAQEDIYNLCDKLGMMIIDQADIDTHLQGTSRKLGGNPSNDPKYEELYFDRVFGAYDRSKDHISVSGFSIATNSANGYNLYSTYLAMKDAEERRPILYDDAKGEWNSDLLKQTQIPEGGSGTYDAQSGLMAVFTNITTGEVEITNGFLFAPVKNISFKVKNGTKIVATGIVDQYIPPRGSVVVKLPVNRKIDPKMTIEVAPAQAYMAPKGAEKKKVSLLDKLLMGIFKK